MAEIDTFYIQKTHGIILPFDSHIFFYMDGWVVKSNKKDETHIFLSNLIMYDIGNEKIRSRLLLYHYYLNNLSIKKTLFNNSRLYLRN